MKRSAISFRSIKNLVFFSILVFSASSAFCEWHFQDSGTTETLYDVCFVDENHGWAVGYNSTIIATTDGGKSWVRQVCPVDSFILRKVEFINEQVGYCIGDTHPLKGLRVPDGTFFHTHDGGVSWRAEKFDLYNFWSMKDIVFVDENNGWISGLSSNKEKHYDYGILIHTDNGGETWETLMEYNNGGITSFDFIDENIGWAFCQGLNASSSEIYKTSDGGQNWTEIYRPLFAKRVYAVSADTLWSSGPRVARSFDGGYSWNGQEGNPDPPVHYLYPVDESRAYSVSYNPRFFGYTVDGGTTFKNLRELEFHCWGITGVGNEHVWFIGSDGKILKFTGESTGINTKENSLPSSLILEQNSPNPFNSSTSITFSVTRSENITINIYNVEGKKIFTLVSRFHGPGTYTYSWNGKDEKGYEVASGVYFYEVKTDTNLMRKKMLLIR